MPALYNIGWAGVQISNMAIVNQITKSNRKRDRLSNNRNGMTQMSYIIVNVAALLTFIVVKDQIDQFRIQAVNCSLIGIITTGFYLYHIREIPLTISATENEDAYQKQVSLEKGER